MYKRNMEQSVVTNVLIREPSASKNKDDILAEINCGMIELTIEKMNLKNMNLNSNLNSNSL